MRFTRLVTLLLVFYPVLTFAQHIELGAFGNYSHQALPNGPNNLFGIGARGDINLASWLQFELESAYDFQYPHFQTTAQSNAVVLNSSELGVIHVNAGLKVQTKGGSFFGFVKGGVNQYRIESSVQTVTASPPSVIVVNSPDRNFSKGVLYPGVGIGFHAGPLGIRMDAGDEIIWLNGSVHNSFRATFGPTLRF